MEGEKMGGAEGGDKEREEDEARDEADDELARGAWGEAEAIGAERTAFDEGHEPGGEEDGGEDGGFKLKHKG